MSSWRCAHRRSSPLIGTNFADLASWPSIGLAAALQSAPASLQGIIALELEQRRLKCPACRAQDRSVRRARALVIALGLVLLLVGWRLHG